MKTIATAIVLAAGLLSSGAANAQSVDVETMISRLFSPYKGEEYRNVMVPFRSKVYTHAHRAGIKGLPADPNMSWFDFNSLTLRVVYDKPLGNMTERREMYCTSAACIFR